MPGSVISCGRIRLNSAGFSQVCPGSKDNGAAGLQPERSQQGQGLLGLGRQDRSVPTLSMLAWLPHTIGRSLLILIQSFLNIKEFVRIFYFVLDSQAVMWKTRLSAGSSWLPLASVRNANLQSVFRAAEEVKICSHIVMNSQNNNISYLSIYAELLFPCRQSRCEYSVVFDFV